jgi:hypothetical protein
VPRDRSRAPTASPRTVFGDGPASRFANLRSGSRHPRRAQSGDRFFIPRRARNRSVGGCRISGFPSTSSRGRRRADVVVVVVVVVARRVAAVEDASATRARRERDANRREPTTVRAAAIERRGATEARARRFAFDLESRRSFASTREFRRVEGANADDARARDVG